ncbi:hypothetical protein [Paenibacillus sp. HB172176]|uniref:hypothetical protein n=1 Tax=Paenibacillus sp. HB172176 TaxID=2493690 RepID=UPI00143ACC27|nr:hypothetical protein [Paenibacillus sp. HB172176]
MIESMSAGGAKLYKPRLLGSVHGKERPDGRIWVAIAELTLRPFHGDVAFFCFYSST